MRQATWRVPARRDQSVGRIALDWRGNATHEIFEIVDDSAEKRGVGGVGEIVVAVRLFRGCSFRFAEEEAGDHEIRERHERRDWQIDGRRTIDGKYEG